MYNTESLIGKIISIKLVSGVEIMAKLMSFIKEDKTIILEEPRTVVIMDNQIAVVPYQYTGPSKEVAMSTDNVLSIVESLENSANDYLKLIENPESK
jgi:DNA/RNA-binding domain of Phe-tRNA-synthetase-like protein